MKTVFVDANQTLADGVKRLSKSGEPEIKINLQPDITPSELPAIIDDAQTILIDHTALPVDITKQCAYLRDIVFLGTGARSYMDPERLAEIGITVHTISGYGDTAVAECTISLMWASAKNLAYMDREMRAGRWTRTDGMQLTGKTLGLIGFGNIAQEVARMATGMGLRVLAWNRSAKNCSQVKFVDLDELLAQSDIVSIHLAFNDETKNFLSSDRIATMKPGGILINTARGLLVDEAAMIEALETGHLRHAGLDVYAVEPMPEQHRLIELPNVTLSAHSAFRTPEASDNLIKTALEYCEQINSDS